MWKTSMLGLRQGRLKLKAAQQSLRKEMQYNEIESDTFQGNLTQNNNNIATVTR